MARLIVVCGATGQLGGSVARRFLQEGWIVRAITRNPAGAAAKELSAKGAETVAADYDDSDSLVKAFDGAQAIFVVTQFWEHIMQLGADGAGQKEYDQILRIADVANKVSTLEHFVLHTLGSGEKLKGKGWAVPHWDYKDKAADEIRKSLPDLAAKTTFLWVGWFTSNMFNLLKPVELPGSYGGYLWVTSVPEDTVMWISGDIENNVGLYVHAIVSNRKLSTPAKYAHVHTDVVPYGDALKQWNEVTGKRGVYLDAGEQKMEILMGAFGTELNAQFKLNAAEPDWEKPYRSDMVTAEQLGITDKLLNHRQSLEKNKHKLLP